MIVPANAARKIAPFMNRQPTARLEGGDNIIAVDGESPNVDGRACMVWFRLKYEPGDEVTLTIVRNGKKEEITYKAGRHIDDERSLTLASGAVSDPPCFSRNGFRASPTDGLQDHPKGITMRLALAIAALLMASQAYANS